MRLYDIKFKGERIIFELGLQEAVAHYAGQDPVQSGIGYLDSYYGFGPYAFNLIPGYDIPFYAKCLGATYHEGEEAVVSPARFWLGTVTHCRRTTAVSPCTRATRDTSCSVTRRARTSPRPRTSL